jgi:ArsR family transcriptional regulator
VISTAPDVTAQLKVLGDPTRLRILALIESEELSVGELSRALGMSQSRVSNHLRLLRRAGWLAERRAGTTTFLKFAHASGDASSDPLWNALRPRIAALPAHRADLLRLTELTEERARRSADFFDSVAGTWDKIGVDFASGQARQRAAASLLAPGMVVADVGCGTGYMAESLLGLVERVICVDRSRAMLAQAERRLTRDARGTQLEFRQGELDALPIADAELDGLVAGMVLHHLADLAPALSQMRRVLKPGAVASVLELAPHQEDWMRESLGDRYLGLEPAEVLAAFERAGFEHAQLAPLEDAYQPRPPAADERVRLPLYLVRARAPRSS